MDTTVGSALEESGRYTARAMTGKRDVSRRGEGKQEAGNTVTATNQLMMRLRERYGETSKDRDERRTRTLRVRREEFVRLEQQRQRKQERGSS